MVRHRKLDGLDDGELLALTATEPEAFGVFYDRFEGPLLAFFYRATRRADLAADLTGEVFAAALQSSGRYSPQLGSARAWLFGIARNELADAWQRGAVEDRARRALEIETMVLSTRDLERIERFAEDDAVADLLETLPPDQAAAITGRVIEDRDYADLAVSLRCSESVVRQRVSRGLRSLRERLES